MAAFHKAVSRASVRQWGLSSSPNDIANAISQGVDGQAPFYTCLMQLWLPWRQNPNNVKVILTHKTDNLLFVYLLQKNQFKEGQLTQSKRI